MRRLFLVLPLFLACLSSIQAQPFRHKYYDFSLNVNDIIAEAEAWFAANGTGPGKGYKGYQRWKYEQERRFGPSGDRSQFDPGIAQREYARFRATQATQRAMGATGHWTFLGPNSANNILPPSWAAGVGQIAAVWGDAVTADTIYLGSRSGGFWKTTDGGSTWRSTTQDLAAVGVVDIQVHPLRANEVWILTRHATGYTYGLLKSTDFGETWASTGLTYAPGTSYGNEFYIASADTIYASTNGGIQRSTDGGSTFTQVYPGNMMAIKVHPTNSQILYAFDSNSASLLRRSTDGGQTWANHTVTGNAGYSFLATSAAAPNNVYVAGNTGVFRSTDTGLSWTQLCSDPTNSGFMCFGVSDTDPGKLFAGSLNQYVSTDAGATWNVLADWINFFGANYMHADGRVMRAYGNRMFMGTDGFLARSLDNGQNWTRVNEVGTGVREFYRIGCSPTRADAIVGGSQDNGTSVMLDHVWYEWIGADGMQAHFDRNNPDIWFGTIQNGALQRTTQAGQNAADVSPPNGSGAWITPSVIDPSNENTLFLAYDSVYKSVDNGSTWDGLIRFNGSMDEIAISPVDSNVLYISKNTRLRRSTDNGLTWSFSDTGLPNLYITRIAMHPFDPQHLCVSFSGFTASAKVYESTNGGLNWTNISGNLPNLPANSLIWSEGPPARLFVGMDAGVYYRDMGSSTWTLYADSLPAVAINDLEVLEGAGLLRAGTWGRGAWEAPLPGREGMPQIVRILMDPTPLDTRPGPADSMAVRARVVHTNNVQGAVLRWGLDGINFPNAVPMYAQTIDTFATGASIPPQVEGTRVYFRITVFVTGGDTVRSDRIMYQVQPPILCAAAGSQGTSFDFIDTVRVNTLNHASQQEYYGDFRQIHTDLYRDSTYTMMISLNYAFSLDSMFAWIDWNGNGSLQDPGEQIIMGALDADSKSYGTFTVPHVPHVPDTVAMRVRSIYASNPVSDPCNDYFGEVEDYSIVIRDVVMVGLDERSASALQLFPNPADGYLEIVFPGIWEEAQLRVVDMQGKTMASAEGLPGPGYRVNTKDFAVGVYWVEFRSGNTVARARFGVVR